MHKSKSGNLIWQKPDGSRFRTDERYNVPLPYQAQRLVDEHGLSRHFVHQARRCAEKCGLSVTLAIKEKMKRA
jgi:hypothetical protein